MPNLNNIITTFNLLKRNGLPNSSNIVKIEKIYNMYIYDKVSLELKTIRSKNP